MLYIPIFPPFELMVFGGISLGVVHSLLVKLHFYFEFLKLYLWFFIEQLLEFDEGKTKDAEEAAAKESKKAE